MRDERRSALAALARSPVRTGDDPVRPELLRKVVLAGDDPAAHRDAGLRCALRSCVRCVNHEVANDVSPPMSAPAKAANAEI